MMLADMNFTGDWVLNLVALIITIMGGLIIKAMLAKARERGANEVRQQMTVGPQPFQIDLLKDNVVRREDLQHFQDEIKSDVKDMRGMYQQLIITLNERDSKFREKIDTVDSRMQESRTRIHEKINNHADRIKAVEVQADIGKAIGQLGKALLKSNSRNPQSA